ncbi:MAG: LicD family protein [Dehalococcoidia bacterium]
MKPTVFEPMDMTTAESLLKEAKQILGQLGLAFFLRHGTCLGAVRDQAFIEWDDDLDIGSVIGLHGITEERVREAADVFRERGFDTSVTDSELHLSVSLEKSGTQMDWTCYRIIDDSIYQWPVIKIPVDLHTNLKEIDFLGERFLVPNPPEEYLRLKYGAEWMIPKRAGDFEQEVLDLMAETSPHSGTGEALQLNSEFVPNRHNGSLKVLDFEDRPVESAEVALAATTILTGLEKSHTNGDGQVYFSLPEKACYVVAVRYGDHNEILYLEELEPGVDYVYRPDPANPSGRANALIPEQT